MNFGTDQFSGCIPKTPAHLNKIPYADYCLDANLIDGQLQPFRTLKPVLQKNIEEYNKYVLMKCCWVKIPLCASYAEDTNCNVFYITGRNTYPEEVHINSNNCEPVYYRLGLPCPDSKIIATDGDTCEQLDRSSTARTYVYQYVNSRGQRSQVSPPSDAILVNDCSPVLLSGWTKPDSTWDVTSIRIYRSVIFFGDGKDGSVQDSDYLFVDEISIDSPSYVDEKCDIELNDILYEDSVKPPPCDLQGIIAISGVNTFAGFCKNKVYFTRNNMPWNWDIELVLDDNVKALAESSGTLYVATEGRPYAIEGAVDCNSADCRKVIKFEDPLPMLGYGNNSFVGTPYGAFYPSIDGIVGLKGNSNPVIFTGSLYSQEQWAEFLPHDLVLTYNNGILYVFGKKKSAAMFLGGNTRSEHNNHTYLSDDDVIYAFNGNDGFLYVEKEDGVYQFDKGIDFREFIWVSPEATYSTPINFGAGNAIFERDKLHIRVAGDERVLLERDLLVSNRPFRLPMWGTSHTVQFELRGKCVVKKLILSTSNKEL